MLRRAAGRPLLPRMDLAAQRRRTMWRCQRTIVSGVTSSRSPWRRAVGITPSRVANRARSAQFRFGRRGTTASWWRRIKISAVCHASSRRDSRSHEATRVIRRKTNRRHMIGDHHGRTAGRATVLVRAADAILGTRNLHRRDARAGQDRIERIGELPGAVADQETDPVAELEQFALDPLVSPAWFSVASRSMSVTVSVLTWGRPVRCG
jgi:hypothetical protein